MKKTLLALSFLFLFANKAQAITNLGAFEIENFHVGIDIKEKGEMRVDETIEVIFSESRHGIFREIPYKYKNKWGQNYNLKMEVVSVQNENGKNWNFETNNSGGNLIVKIGDADKYVEERQIYKIGYKVKNGIRFFELYDELYWNPIGTKWPTTIKNANVNINLPAETNLSDENDLICFTGPFGSGKQDCEGKIVSGEKITFSANSRLGAYEGLTVAVKFPKGYLQEPTRQEKIIAFLIDNWGYAIPIVVFVLMYSFWFSKGKEINLSRSIVAQYEPPDGLSPSEMGYLWKERCQNNFIAADIVNLAVKGYLEITEIEGTNIGRILMDFSGKGGANSKIKFFKKGWIIPIFIIMFFLGFIGPIIITGIILSIFILHKARKMKLKSKAGSNGKQKEKTSFMPDFELTSLKDWASASDLTEHEQRLLSGLFVYPLKSKKLSKIKNFYKDAEQVEKKIKKQIAEKKYFHENFWNLRAMYLFPALASGIVLIMIGVNGKRIDLAIAGALSAMIIFFFGRLMSKKTRLGAEAHHHVLGFREYIKTAEKHRVKFQEQQNLFEKFLPYAMVFGLADKWAKAFEGILKETPSWYKSTSGKAFTSSSFVSSISNFSSFATSASAPPSSSSSGFFGSGSSGGGGGGGGGGSW